MNYNSKPYENRDGPTQSMCLYWPPPLWRYAYYKILCRFAFIITCVANRYYSSHSYPQRRVCGEGHCGRKLQ